MTALGWFTTERPSAGGGRITTFTSPWPHGGKAGDIRYARCSPATGWRLFVVGDGPDGHGDLYDVPFATALERLPDALRLDLIEVQRGMVEECGRIADRWIDRRQRYLRELRSAESA